MNLFAFAETVENYAQGAVKKANNRLAKLFWLAVLAGMLIALAAATTNTATHAMTDVGLSRTLSGVLFPFGLVMVVLSGAELFTGNCLMTIGLLDKRISISGLLRNLLTVYVGNFVGSILVAAGCALFGQLNYSGGKLAVAAIKAALSKSTMPFANAFVQAIFCNVLVCLAVLFALSAKDVAGRVIGGYMPICFFVVCGFPHSIADMFYVPVGLFALTNPAYAAQAAQAGLEISKLTWGAYIVGDMIPVTLGNILGGVAVSTLAWYLHLRQRGAVKA